MRKNWDKIREKGRFRYIFINGVLQWGIPVGICSEIIKQIIRSGLNCNFLYDAGFYASLIVGTAIFGVGGILFGLITWHLYEDEWQQENNAHTIKKDI